MTCPYCHASQNWTRKRASSAPSGVGAPSGKAPPPFGGVAAPAPASVLGVRAAQRKSSPVPSLAMKAATPDQKGIPIWLWVILGITAILIMMYL